MTLAMEASELHLRLVVLVDTLNHFLYSTNKRSEFWYEG